MVYDFDGDPLPMAPPVAVGPFLASVTPREAAASFLSLALIELHDRGVHDPFTRAQMFEAARAYFNDWTPDPDALADVMAHDLDLMIDGRYRSKVP